MIFFFPQIEKDHIFSLTLPSWIGLCGHGERERERGNKKKDRRVV